MKKISKEQPKFFEFSKENLIKAENEIIQTEELVIPHPHIKERKFVLKPWSDIDSDYIIANENRKIKELLESTTDSSILKKIQA